MQRAPPSGAEEQAATATHDSAVHPRVTVPGKGHTRECVPYDRISTTEISGWLKASVPWGWHQGSRKGHKTLEGDRHIAGRDCGSGPTGAHACQSSSNRTLKIRAAHRMSVSLSPACSFSKGLTWKKRRQNDNLFFQAVPATHFLIKRIGAPPDSEVVQVQAYKGACATRALQRAPPPPQSHLPPSLHIRLLRP